MLRIENLNYKIGNFHLKDINLEFENDRYFVLLGPTGSGKTTLLKCILGLNKITAGKISIDGKEITDLPPEERNIGYLPQNYLLFPGMSVFENIAFGLKIRKKAGREIKDEVLKTAELLNLTDLLNRKINTLSGGEAQRAALARAVVVKPDILLLDEPFSAIHEGLKSELWFEFKNILKKLQIPTIHITHNLDEGHAVADTMGIIINGKLVQYGQPDGIFSKPETTDVAEFLGLKNIFEGQIISHDGQNITIEYSGLKINAHTRRQKITSGLKINPIRDGGTKNIGISNRVKFCIRPDAVKIVKEGYPVRDELRENVFDAEIISSYFFSDTCIMKLRISSGGEKSVFTAKLPSLIYKRYNLKDDLKIKTAFWKEGIIIFEE